jgi:hypothetical protein
MAPCKKHLEKGSQVMEPSNDKDDEPPPTMSYRVTITNGRYISHLWYQRHQYPQPISGHCEAGMFDKPDNYSPLAAISGIASSDVRYSHLCGHSNCSWGVTLISGVNMVVLSSRSQNTTIKDDRFRLQYWLQSKLTKNWSTISSYKNSAC